MCRTKVLSADRNSVSGHHSVKWAQCFVSVLRDRQWSLSPSLLSTSMYRNHIDVYLWLYASSSDILWVRGRSWLHCLCELPLFVKNVID
jgi:hypothetical protein